MLTKNLFPTIVFLVSFCCVKNMKIEELESFRASPQFVDKTLLIKEFFRYNSSSQIVMFAAPDGFGKTSNLQLMKGFLLKDSNVTQVGNIYSNTKIAEDNDFIKNEMRNHSVLYIAFQHNKPIVDHKSLIRVFRSILYKTFALHPFLAKSTKLSGYDKKKLTSYTGVKKHLKMRPFQILVGIHFLSRLLRNHYGRQVVLMIDDFDSIFLDSIFTNELEYETVLGFLNAFLRATLENNEYLSKTILMGVSCMLVKPLQHLIPFQCISFLEDKHFSPFFGLTDEEISHLLQKEEFVNLRNKRTSIFNWYGGYLSPDLGIRVYNTRSVMCFLKSGQFNNFWVENRAWRILKYLLVEPVVQQLFNDTIGYRQLKIRQQTSLENISTEHIHGIKSFSVNELWDENFADLFMRLLLEKGYFTFATKIKTKDKQFFVKCPNKEVHKVFNQIQTTFYHDSTELLDRLKEAVRQASFPLTNKEDIEQIVAEQTAVTVNSLSDVAVEQSGVTENNLADGMHVIVQKD